MTARFGMILLALTLPLSFAAAQETNESAPPQEPTRPDDAAWVEDCPPDMMCAAGTPNQYGSEDCIDCSGPVDGGEGVSCMDGSAPAEECSDEVVYLDGRGPPDCENCRGETAEPISAPADSNGAAESPAAPARSVPAPAIALLLLGVVVGAVVLARKG